MYKTTRIPDKVLFLFEKHNRLLIKFLRVHQTPGIEPLNYRIDHHQHSFQLCETADAKMAYYFDHRKNDLVFSEHAFNGGGQHHPPDMREGYKFLADYKGAADDLININGDLYDMLKGADAQRAAQGLPPEHADSFIMKDPRFADLRRRRDEGDRRPVHLWQDWNNYPDGFQPYGGHTRGLNSGDLRPFPKPGDLTQVSWPIFSPEWEVQRHGLINEALDCLPEGVSGWAPLYPGFMPGFYWR